MTVPILTRPHRPTGEQRTCTACGALGMSTKDPKQTAELTTLCRSCVQAIKQRPAPLLAWSGWR